MRKKNRPRSRAARPRRATSEQSVLAMEHRLIGLMRDFLAGEVRETRSEIARSTGLLRDAVGTLNTSFREMEAQTRQQGSTITGLVERGAVSAGGGSLSVRHFAQEAGKLIGDLAHLVEQGSRESVRTVEAMDETVGHLDEIFALVGEHPSASSDRIRELIGTSKRAVARVRSRVEDTAEREMSASVDAKIKADGLLAQVEAITRSLAEGMHVVASCSDHIRESVATAVRSLQFEDITTQALAAAISHLDRVSALNEEATPLEESLVANGSGSSAVSRLRSLEQFGEYLQKLRGGSVRPPRKSVSQADMRAGTVDLF